MCMRQFLKAGWLLCGLTLVLAGTAGSVLAAPETVIAPDAPPLEVVEVTGERAGPGLWKVAKGANTVFILGTFNPLPRRMTWRSRQVETVLDRASQVIPYRPDLDASIGPIKAFKMYRQWRRLRRNPDDATLQQVLPPELFARFETLRFKYAPGDRSMLELRPLLAANELSQAAIKSVGLKTDSDVADAVLKLAKKRKVAIVKLRQRVEDPQGVLADLGNINAATERACLAATLARLDADVSTLRDRANAWAIGDVEKLRSQAADEQRASCMAALTSAPRINEITAEFDKQWLAAVINAADNQQVTLAISPIGRLLQKDGVLAQLAARGYQVTAP
jgi:uncharacterized protein YbaP (TraB family)